MMDIEKEFRRRLVYARKSHDFSQEWVSRLTGLEPSAISHFETGQRKPSFRNLRKLSKALAVSVDYLLVISDDPNISIPNRSIFRVEEK